MVFSLLVLSTALASAAGDCRCACLNGVPSTLCTNVVAAQGRPDLCPWEMRCPPLRGAAPGLLLTAPQTGAVDCREDQVWDPSTARYTVRNVCAVESVKD